MLYISSPMVFYARRVPGSSTSSSTWVSRSIRRTRPSVTTSAYREMCVPPPARPHTSTPSHHSTPTHTPLCTLPPTHQLARSHPCLYHRAPGSHSAPDTQPQGRYRWSTKVRAHPAHDRFADHALCASQVNAPAAHPSCSLTHNRTQPHTDALTQLLAQSLKMRLLSHFRSLACAAFKSSSRSSQQRCGRIRRGPAGASSWSCGASSCSTRSTCLTSSA